MQNIEAFFAQQHIAGILHGEAIRIEIVCDGVRYTCTSAEEVWRVVHICEDRSNTFFTTFTCATGLPQQEEVQQGEPPTYEIPFPAYKVVYTDHRNPEWFFENPIPVGLRR